MTSDLYMVHISARSKETTESSGPKKLNTNKTEERNAFGTVFISFYTIFLLIYREKVLNSGLQSTCTKFCVCTICMFVEVKCKMLTSTTTCLYLLYKQCLCLDYFLSI